MTDHDPDRPGPTSDRTTDPPSDREPEGASGLTHLDSEGRPRMVDVADKDVTSREAVAVGRIRMSAEALDAILRGRTEKGDVLKVAELAGIMAGKRTGEIIPLCHLLPAVSLTVELEPDSELPGVSCRASARIAGQTGVEMEALTAATTALLTVYDMVKSLDRGMRIEGVELVRKSGGRSGTWTAGEGAGEDRGE
ncbi:MAG: cyclic pyranopterin monophosphate synthase MoaC [Longimicrobiales bacterium]|nr:cyclic pyranopterin monophosphate synthase MoaC [Longimicrobiales bacterium]